MSCLLISISCLGYGQTGGIIFTDRSAPLGVVSFPATFKLSAISNTNHIDGYVKQNGNAPFVFPVGHQGQYRPFGAHADGTLGAYYQQNPATASNPTGAPFALLNKEGILAQISPTEFWHIKGTNATQLTLTWNQTSAVSELTQAQLALLSIAGWNPANSRWEAISSLVDPVALLGGESTLTSGSITTVERIVPNTYSVYTLASRTSANLPASYNGKLEKVSCAQIQGWIWDKNYPSSTLTVEIMEGNTVHATALADQSRPDLQQAGIGTGKYGFGLPLPTSLIDGQSHQVSVRVKGSHYILDGANQVINCGYSGNLEMANCVEVTGWVWDKNAPAIAQTVELIEGNTVHASSTANQYRADLQQAGTGTGQYGFRLPIPVQLRDGKAHQLGVRIQNISYTLPNSPKSINCPVPDYVGYLESVTCNTIGGFVWDKNNPAASQTVELLEGTTVLATATANGYRESLKTLGASSTGNYVFSLPTPSSLKDGK
ncbi:T9SS C-terminal target domain-containing protein, partial [Larkinella insperata]